MTRINGIDPVKMGQNDLKLDTIKDIKDFLRQFTSISEAKRAIGAIIDEIREISPSLAQKLEKLLQALDKADKQGMTLDDFINNIDKMLSNENAAMQGISPMQEAQAVFNDNAAVDSSRVSQTSSIA